MLLVFPAPHFVSIASTSGLVELSPRGGGPWYKGPPAPQAFPLAISALFPALGKSSWRGPVRIPALLLESEGPGASLVSPTSCPLGWELFFLLMEKETFTPNDLPTSFFSPSTRLPAEAIGPAQVERPRSGGGGRVAPFLRLCVRRLRLVGGQKPFIFPALGFGRPFAFEGVC